MCLDSSWRERGPSVSRFEARERGPRFEASVST